jgi:transposase
MLTLPPSVRVYIAARPTDLRKSFDGLSALVAERFGQDPLSGHLFVFRNRRGDQIRVLFWDRTGYAIFGKKLARGRFYLARPIAEEATHVEIEAAELALMLEGIDLRRALRRTRWRPPETGNTAARSSEPGRLLASSAAATPAPRDPLGIGPR